MPTYRCLCNNVIFFDNSHCVACKRELGLLPGLRQSSACFPRRRHLQCGNQSVASVAKCFNYSQLNVCNRCLGRAMRGRRDCATVAGSTPRFPIWRARQLAEMVSPGSGQAAAVLRPETCWDCPTGRPPTESSRR